MESSRLSLLLYYFILTLVGISSTATKVLFVEDLSIDKIWIVLTELV